MGQLRSTKRKKKKLAYVRDDRVVVNENSHDPELVGLHGLVRTNRSEFGYPEGRPIEVYLDGRPGGNQYFAEEALDPEVP
jgi:hypothetical protein